jgi:hypothetical protein
MLSNKILIDFVAGAHGHFLEVMLNKFFHTAAVDFDPFTDLGTSHVSTPEYHQTKLFHAGHWSERDPESLKLVDKIISIKFSQDQLLLFSSISMLRAKDQRISNDDLEHDTYNKLNNQFYRDTLDQILSSYPLSDVNESNSDIPRHVLREFYKFGFKNPGINGYWIKQQQMRYPASADVFYFDLACFYDRSLLAAALKQLELFVDKKFDFSHEFYQMYLRFFNSIPYLECQSQCDQIIRAVINQVDYTIPSLTLFQESYINAKLENYYAKEMPFHQLNYFTNTKDMWQYIETQAPNL